jgi:hypothetical protein
MQSQMLLQDMIKRRNEVWLALLQFFPLRWAPDTLVQINTRQMLESICNDPHVKIPNARLGGNRSQERQCTLWEFVQEIYENVRPIPVSRIIVESAPNSPDVFGLDHSLAFKKLGRPSGTHFMMKDDDWIRASLESWKYTPV